MTSRKSAKKRDKVLVRVNRGLSAINNTLSILKKNDVIPCFDIENFEWLQTRILEVGVSYIDTKSLSVIGTDHYVVKDHYSCRNGKYVCDNKDNFDFGTSQILHLPAIKLAMSTIMRQHNVVAAYGISGDEQSLQNIGIPIPAKRIDVPTLFDAVYIDPRDGKGHSSRGLSKVAERFGYSLVHPHNAGNDAHITALCLVDILKKVRDDGPSLKHKFELLKGSLIAHNEYMKFIYEDG